jgi:integrase
MVLPRERETVAKGRITKKVVTAARPEQREYFIWDADLPGFAIRVLASGVKSYVVQYRAGPGRRAPTRRITIGKHGKLTPDEARKLARKIIADVAYGEDPAAELTYRRREITVANLAERYVSEHVRVHNKPSTILEMERLVRSEIIPAFGRMRLSDLTRPEIKKWHTARHRTPYNANRALAALRKMLSLAVKEWELCDENPALGVKLFRETKREQFVTDDELRKIGKWLAESEREGTEFAGAIKLTRLLAFTGMRLNEVRTLEWSSVDADAGLIRLSDGKTGARLVPIGMQARTLLSSASREGRFVVSDGEDDAPLSVRKFRTFWSHLRKGTGLSEIRPHDLRHTVGTFAAQAGANAFLVRDLLGHKTLAMTGRYVERANEPVRAVADQVSARVASAMKGLLPAGVVQFKKRRK